MTLIRINHLPNGLFSLQYQERDGEWLAITCEGTEHETREEAQENLDGWIRCGDYSQAPDCVA